MKGKYVSKVNGGAGGAISKGRNPIKGKEEGREGEREEESEGEKERETREGRSINMRNTLFTNTP